MNPLSMTRREWIAAGSVIAGAAALPRPVHSKPSPDGFTYCLNMSTIRGHKLPLEEEIDLAGKARNNANLFLIELKVRGSDSSPSAQDFS